MTLWPRKARMLTSGWSIVCSPARISASGGGDIGSTWPATPTPMDMRSINRDPTAYRWRDWVIDAVNRDLPFDQFTIEQFAGDLVPEAESLSRLATAYHRQTLTNNEGGVDKEEYRLKAVLDRVSNTGTVWLGLTLGCAQCHDHPYDRFTQREFYALAAIFNNADEAEIELPEGAARRPPLKFRVLAERETPRVTRLLKRGEFLQPGDEVLPGLPAIANRESNADQERSIGWTWPAGSSIRPIR